MDADDVWVSIDDYSGQMVFEEGVGWVGFVPVERLARPRLYHVVVDTSNNGIYSRTYLSELLVEAEVAVIDEITLDAENAALLTPELVAIDNHTRFEQYKRPEWAAAVVGPVGTAARGGGQRRLRRAALLQRRPRDGTGITGTTSARPPAPSSARRRAAAWSSPATCRCTARA